MNNLSVQVHAQLKDELPGGPFHCIAIMKDWGNWIDPYGGEYHASEQKALDAFVSGKTHLLEFDDPWFFNPRLIIKPSHARL